MLRSLTTVLAYLICKGYDAVKLRREHFFPLSMPFVFRYHHSAADTPDKMSPQQLQQCAATLATWVYAIASLDDILPRDESDVSTQSSK